MRRHKPTLVSFTLYRQIIATLVALCVVLVVLVFTADRILMNMAIAEIRKAQQEQPLTEQVQQPMSGQPYGMARTQNRGAGGMHGMHMGGQGGALLVDTAGTIVTSRPPGRNRLIESTTITSWLKQQQLPQKLQSQGIDKLPWTDTTVIWSAITNDDFVDIRWKRTEVIRKDAMGYYIIVTFAVLASGLIGLMFSFEGARKIAKSVNQVAQQSSQIADGRFDVSVASQPTVELQVLADSLNDLSYGLDQTIKELQHEHHKLMQLESNQRQFVADASHELRAPLNALLVTLSAWKEGLLQPSEQDSAVVHMHKEVTRLTRLVQSILELSRIESGQYPLDIQSVDLPAVIQHTLASLPHDGAQISVSLPSELPPVRGCIVGIQMILINLLDNARRYTPVDGTITIAVTTLGKDVRITITDTGQGIPSDQLTDIWQRYSKGQPRDGQSYSGTGLGLSIVRRLTEAMEGSIELRSEVGNGTQITVILPVFQGET